MLRSATAGFRVEKWDPSFYVASHDEHQFPRAKQVIPRWEFGLAIFPIDVMIEHPSSYPGIAIDKGPYLELIWSVLLTWWCVVCSLHALAFVDGTWVCICTARYHFLVMCGSIQIRDCLHGFCT